MRDQRWTTDSSEFWVILGMRGKGTSLAIAWIASTMVSERAMVGDFQGCFPVAKYVTRGLYDFGKLTKSDMAAS